MFNQNGGYSLADIAAATGVRNGNGDGMFGDNGWWIILLFLFAGWGGNGFGWGGGVLHIQLDLQLQRHGTAGGVHLLKFQGIGIHQGEVLGFLERKFQLCDPFFKVFLIVLLVV